MRIYTQLIQEQRYQIKAPLKAEHNQTEIAEILEVHKSTICRELKRNTGLRGYRPKQTQTLTTIRQANNVNTCVQSETWQWVNLLLRED